MKNQGVYQFYKDLPPWAKGVAVVSAIAVLSLISLGIINRIKKDAKRKESELAVNESNKDLKQLQSTGMKATIKESQAQAWAGQIQTQFSGCDFSSGYYSTSLPFASDSFLKLASIIKQLKNDVDWLMMVKAYGVRSYDQCGLMNGDFEGDLYKAIEDELSTPEKQELNKLLQSKGISYRVS